MRDRETWGQAATGALVVAAIASSVLLGLAFVPRTTPEPAAAPTGPFSAVPSEPGESPVPPGEDREPLPMEAWSPTFRRGVADGRWSGLDRELDRIAAATPAVYEAEGLGYLQARVALARRDFDRARAAFAPFLHPSNPLRPLALYWAAETEEGAGRPSAASDLRTSFLTEYPEDPRFREVLEEEVEARERADPSGASLFGLVEQVGPVTKGRLRRELDALLVGVFVSQGDLEPARDLGFRILRASDADDAAEQTAVALDRPDVLSVLTVDEKRLLGEALRSHRHFERAIDLLRKVREAVPRDRSQVTFSIGRALFFAERYEEALTAYLEGAAEARDGNEAVRFLYHASRAAMLLGRDDEALAILDRAVARGGSGRTRAAVLENRLRVRLERGDVEDAERDLAILRREYGRAPLYGQAALAVASDRIVRGDAAGGLAVLRSVSDRSLDRYGEVEADYWRARGLETEDPSRAIGLYVDVALAPDRSHFAYFARDRLTEESLRPMVADRLAAARERAEAAVGRGDLAGARRAAAEVAALGDERGGRVLLAGIYRKDEAYGRYLNLKPLPWPSFPLEEDASRAERLLALGLFDDAREDLGALYSLRDPREALTRSLALSRAGRPLEAIRAAEILVDRVPSDYRFEMLPRGLKQQLYPRPYLDRVAAEARTREVDPRLMLAIMREESRFDARAKSAAAARGLMQFVIGTAREVGPSLGLEALEARDLYDPAVAVRLGAGYLASLQKRFEQEPAAVVAAYNAGPNQASLWARLAPVGGTDVYLTNVSFEETRSYLRRVLNTYERYAEVWGEGEPSATGMVGGR